MSFLDVTAVLWGGFQTTLLLFVLTLVFSLPLGLVISFGSMSKFTPLRLFVKVIVWIVRGTPLMLQVIIIYYVPGMLFGAPMAARFNAALIAFSFNYACYFSEIYRGGIESISHSQYEAGQVLGMTRPQVFFRIIFLQVIKRIIPPTANEVITLVKDTALARVIMVVEIIREAEFMMSRGFIWPLFYTGIFYLLFVGLLTIFFGHIEKRLNYFRT
ncbi:MAG: amino acid ABC transporter permease [Treponema sp.]|jgi:polar amino acid transport system permease protein|nr:amino acid ABC transporter permease [Treponema sp.]